MSYTITPSNYDDIINYIAEHNEETLKGIITAKRCYIIDTCSVEFYKKDNRVGFFAKFVKEEDACIIIFRTILMEMCGDRGSLDQYHIEFIKKLSEEGVKIYILHEEDLFGILSAYTQKGEIGKFFKIAVFCVKGSSGLLNTFVENNEEIKRSIISPINMLGEEYFKHFWTELRHIKKHMDNLGEVVCAICIHMLANMEDINKFKYIFATEDKQAITILGKVISNQKVHNASSNKDMIGVSSSSKIVEEMYKKKILASKEDVEKFYIPFDDQTRIKAIVKGKYDIETKEISFTVPEFAAFIVEDEGIVFY